MATIVVEHRDQCARFGAEEVETALAAQGRRLLAGFEVDEGPKPYEASFVEGLEGNPVRDAA